MPTLTHLPLHKLPRERLWEHGAPALSVEELLKVLLGSGCAAHTVDELSFQIAELLRYGPVSVHALARIPGIGQAKAALISAALELGTALAKQRPATFTEAAEVYNACSDLLTLPQEHLVVFYLNVRNQPTQREIVTVGTATASLVHPREVFRSAISHNVSSIILAHNHPSGDCTPSEADKQATKRVARAGRELGIELLDHVICASKGFTSLRQLEPGLFF